MPDDVTTETPNPPVETPATPAASAEVPATDTGSDWQKAFDGRLSALERKLLGTQEPTQAGAAVPAAQSSADASAGQPEPSGEPVRARASFPMERIPLRSHPLFHRIGRG